MTAYCVFDNVEISDPGAMEDYVARVPPTVEAFGGRYVVVGGPWHVVEGDWRPTYPVIIEFPDIEAAHGWYESEGYRALRDQRQAAGRFDAVFFDSAGADAHFGDVPAHASAE